MHYLIYRNANNLSNISTDSLIIDIISSGSRVKVHLGKSIIKRSNTISDYYAMKITTN